MSATRISGCVLLVAWLWSACESRPTPAREWQPEDHGQPAQVDPAREPQPNAAEPETGGSERAAEALWNVSCASCHGRDGAGQGPNPPPGARMPDFTTAEWQRAHSDREIRHVIEHGRGLMPGFGRQISDQGIDALVAHIRAMGPSQ